jgi:hypothetical protein
MYEVQVSVWVEASDSDDAVVQVGEAINITGLDYNVDSAIELASEGEG